MAAIGKIRSWGPTLVVVIGFALLAFIAEEAFRSCEATSNSQRQQIGEVLGNKIDVQAFQKLMDEYTDVYKVTQGRENLTDEEHTRIKDMVWDAYVQSQILEDETRKLGLTVTDEELQNILNQGTHPALMQTPFVNRETGRFDVNALKQFLGEYKKAQSGGAQAVEQYKSFYNYWTFVEKNLRQQLLMEKYQSLFSHCLLSNPVSAKMSFKDENEESDIRLAAIPYSSINDNQVTVSDSDLKAKYEEYKSRFKQNVETRDIKYVAFQVQASEADKAAIDKEVKEFAAQLQTAGDPTEVVRKSNSNVPYLGIPVSKTAFPSDIAAKIDSMGVGAVVGPYENAADNTLNVIKLTAKTQLPDSVEFRMIQVFADDAAETQRKADSIFAAVKAGGDFELIAKKYGQTGEKTWLTTREYENSPSLDKDTRTYLMALNTMSVNEVRKLEMPNASMVVQVLNRKNFITKYTAAVVKRTIGFSRDTYSQAYNKFSQFVSENQTLEGMEKNAAKYGYVVQERQDMSSAENYVAGISGTKEALRWIFEAKEGKVSPLYECGNNDQLLVVAMTKVNPEGYRSLDNKQINDYIRTEVLKDKKAAMIAEKLKGVNSIEGAEKQGAKVSEVNQITFSSPVFISATGASEPALSGAVAATQKGKLGKHPVKGNAGVYVFQVVDKKMREGKLELKEQEARQRQKAKQAAGNFMSELYMKAKVADKRYLFF
ncbi:MAG: SurA N-terminal domain-containing protein [Prevotella sp.]|nr:SurA N-terminal domain-containing protein [Prevotella sp.]